MGELARFLTIALLAVACGFCGWFGRAYVDGTMISKSEADIYAQARVDAASQFAAQLEAARSDKAAAISRLQAAPKTVSRSCPPGLGAMSDDVAERLRFAFQDPKK